MDAPTQWIATLEWMNYEATTPIVQVTPGLDLTLRSDVVITSSEVFPTADTTHACLLRAAPATIDPLLDEITDYYQTRHLPATIFVSPACSPPDLPERLLQRGFIKNQDSETWLTLDLSALEFPAASPQFEVTPVAQADVFTFAGTFITAFGLPPAVAPCMAQLMEPSLCLPGVYHYLAWHQGEPVATCSLFCHKEFAVLGSAGVVPGYRGGRAISNLAIQAARTARERGSKTLILQTTAGPLFERFLRICGFHPIFTRTSYTLL